MACLLGAHLAPHARVILLGTWPEGVEVVARRGIVLESERGEETIPARATTDPRQAGRADVVLVLVKSWQTERAARQAAEVLAPESLALTLQNGLGNLEKLQAALGPDRALPGVTTLGATLLGPGRVREGGRGPIHLPDDPRLDRFADTLRQAGFNTLRHPTSDLQPLIWGKVVVNCGINPLTALLRVPNGELLARADARLLMERAACEAAEVARAKGIRLPYADPAAQVRKVARATAANRSSMLQDVLRGAPTEVDAINGAAVEEGQRLDVPAPINDVLWRLVRLVSQGPVSADSTLD